MVLLTNVLSDVGLIFNVFEKSPTNTEVIETKTGAVPWPITSVFPGEGTLNGLDRSRRRHRRRLNLPSFYCRRRPLLPQPLRVFARAARRLQ